MESNKNPNNTASIITQLASHQTTIDDDQELIDVTTIKPEDNNINIVADMDIDTDITLKQDINTDIIDSNITPNNNNNAIESLTTINTVDAERNVVDIKLVKASTSSLNNKNEATTSDSSMNSPTALNLATTTTASNTNTPTVVSDIMATTITSNNNGSINKNIDNNNNNNNISTNSNINDNNSNVVAQDKSIQNNAVLNNANDVTVISTTNFEEIQKQLKKTLDHVEQRNMVSGFETLSIATSAVVDHCEQLGLTSDDHPYNAIDREQFWAGLNNCWLYALAQRQEPSSSEEKVTDQHLFKLREKVVAWADKLERFGLVDYEMGWWEADILAAIDGCLALNYAAAQAAVAQVAASLFNHQQDHQQQNQQQQNQQQQTQQQQTQQQQTQQQQQLEHEDEPLRMNQVQHETNQQQ